MRPRRRLLARLPTGGGPGFGDRPSRPVRIGVREQAGRDRDGAGVALRLHPCVERRAQLGVIITTGGFSKAARDAAQAFADKIVLVDGEHLVRLMMDHGVGVSTVERFELLRVDSDYFLDD